jgi:integrase
MSFVSSWDGYQVKMIPLIRDPNHSIFSEDVPDQIHAIIASNGLPCLLPSLYLKELSIGIDRVKNPSTAAYALLAYYRFLQIAERTYDDLYASPQEGPLFSFRYYLCENVKTEITNDSGNKEVVGAFTPTTIKAYLSQIARYYEWLTKEGYLEVNDKRKPLTYKIIRIRKRDVNSSLLSHVFKNSKIELKTTSLLQRLPFEQSLAPHQKINPLTFETLALFRDAIKNEPKAIQLGFELQIQCGLRAAEAITFSSHHITRPDERKFYKCRIGSKVDGCKTKFGKIRTIEIPKALMSDLYEYKFSTERLKYTRSDNFNDEKHTKDRERLFLNNRGKSYFIKSLSNRFGYIRKKIQSLGHLFDHKNHDLRRTFATNWLASEQQKSKNSFFFMATKLMRLLGHENFKTTEKYVIYMNEKNEQFKQAQRVDELATRVAD